MRWSPYAAVTALTVALTLCASLGAAEDTATESRIIQQYKKALELDSQNVKIRFQLAKALLREKLYQEALDNLQAIYGDKPDDIEVNYHLGLAYVGTGELEKASNAFGRVESLNPKRGREAYSLDKAFYNLGIAYQRDGRLEEALKAYEKSIRVEPGQALSYCRRGEAFYDLRAYNEALESFKICDSRMPGDGKARRNIVSTYLAIGIGFISEKEYGKAAVEIKKAVALDPGYENSLYLEGYVHYLTADYKEALKVIGGLRPESEEIVGEMPVLLQNIGAELQERGDWENSEKAFRQAMEFKKNDADLHHLLGVNYIKKGDYQRAVDEIREALRIKPDHQKANLALALATEKLVDEHIRSGEARLARANYSEAIEEFDTALAIDRENQRARSGRETAERGLEGRKDELSRKKMEDVRSRLSMAKRYLDEGKDRDALIAYRNVLAADPENQEALDGVRVTEGFIKDKKEMHTAKGDRYLEVKDFYLAAGEYKVALSYDPDSVKLQEKLTAARNQIYSTTAPLLDIAADSEKKGSLIEAMKQYDEVLKYNPESAEALDGRSRVGKAMENRFGEYVAAARGSLRDGDYIAAVKNLRLADGLKPGSVEVKAELSKALEGAREEMAFKIKAADKAMGEKRYADAAALYDEVNSVDEKDQQAEEGLKRAKRLMADEINKKALAADEAFRQARYSQAYQLYAEILLVDKNNRNAKKMMDEIRQKLDENVEGLVKKGIDEYNSGSVESAAEDFRKVLSIDQSNQTAKKYLAMMDKTRTKARKTASDKDVERLYLRGIEFYTEGKYVDAIKVWEKVLESEPRHAKALLNIEKAKRKLEGVMDVKQ